MMRCAFERARPRKVLPEWWEAAAVACVRVVVVWLVRRTCLSTGWCFPGAVPKPEPKLRRHPASRIDGIP
eukprot:scaffold20134_cov66-Phaeocystis_antarctica.AAC.7